MNRKLKNDQGTQDATLASKKKTVRDVISDGVRWSEAMRVVRECHPEVTIIMPDQKIQVHPGDDIRALISPYVGAICYALDHKAGQWKGYSEECRIHQVRAQLNYYFCFHSGSIDEHELFKLLEDLIFVHKPR